MAKKVNGTSPEAEGTKKSKSSPEAEGTKKSKSSPEAEGTGQPGHYEEWKVELKRDDDGKIIHEKLKRVREVVKITEAEAEALNKMAISEHNKIALMYFQPE